MFCGTKNHYISNFRVCDVIKLVRFFFMSLRIVKGISASDDTITALHWGSLGLVAGSVTGDLFVWPVDMTPDGGLCHLNDYQFYDTHKMAVSSISSIEDLVISISLDESIYATKIVNNTLVEESEKKPQHVGQRILTEIKEPFSVQTVPNLGLIFISTLEGFVYAVDKEFNIKAKKQFINSEIVALSVHGPSNRGAIIGSRDLILFDLSTLEIVKKLTITADNLDSLCFSTDGLSILITTTEGTLRIVDTIAFREVGCQKFDIGELNDLAPINYGKRYIVAGSEGKVGVFNLNHMIKETGIKVASGLVKCVAVQQDDMKVAVAGADNMITLLDFN